MFGEFVGHTGSFPLVRHSAEFMRSKFHPMSAATVRFSEQTANLRSNAFRATRFFYGMLLAHIILRPVRRLPPTIPTTGFCTDCMVCGFVVVVVACALVFPHVATSRSDQQQQTDSTACTYVRIIIIGTYSARPFSDAF